mgnify:CR=1 FL=1
MRPSLNILDPELIGRIVDEAMRVLAETGMEIRGTEMRQRLIDHGLPTDGVAGTTARMVAIGNLLLPPTFTPRSSATYTVMRTST